MSQIVNKTGSRMRKRFDSAKGLIRRELDLVKGVLNDVKERVDLDVNTEPQGTKNLGGIAGQRGSLVKEPIKLIVGTVDNAAQFVQEQAAITREIFQR